MGDPEQRLPSGRLAIVCLNPVGIRRKDTIITDSQFSSGVDLHVSEAIVLRDAGVLTSPGLHLFHRRDGNSQFRAQPDASEENNLDGSADC
jgi:hypothetical protein